LEGERRVFGSYDRFDNKELSTKRENCDERKQAAAQQEPGRWRFSRGTERTGFHTVTGHSESYGIARRKAIFDGIVQHAVYTMRGVLGRKVKLRVMDIGRGHGGSFLKRS
jgi:hypothetical protein